MSTWAVLAAKQAAIATGFGAGLVPGIGTGSLDGFLIGAAMTGACFTVLNGPGRARRRAAATATAETAGAGETVAAGLAAVTGESVAAGLAAVTGERAASGLTTVTGETAEPAAGADSARSALLRRYFLAAEQFVPNWDRAAQAAEHAPNQDQGDSRPDGHAGDWADDSQDVSGYQSRHRLGEGSPIRRPRQETRRSAPKHAAPPSSFASRMTGMFGGRAVLTAARH